MDLSQGFQVQSKKIRLYPVQLPCQSVFSVPSEPVDQGSVAHAAHPHFYNNPGNVVCRHSQFEEDPEHQFIVGGGAKTEIEDPCPGIDFLADEKSGMRGHPAK